jgi:AAA domain
MSAHANGAGPKKRPRSTLEDRLVPVEASWLSEHPPVRDYLATDARTGKGALDTRGVCLLVSAGGVGKSYATCDLALAVATGGTWLGTFTVQVSGKVLIASAEEPPDEIRRRLYYVGRAAGVGTIPRGAIDILDLHDTHAPLLAASGAPTAHADALIDLAQRRGPYRLVIGDPLGRIAGASVDADNALAGALVGVLEAVSSAARGLVLAPHHSDKRARRNNILDATAVRGVTGLSDYARAVLILGDEELEHDDQDVDERLGSVVTLTVAKANHFPKWQPVALRRGPNGELVPLDAPDRELVAEARESARCGAGKRAARAATREAEVRARNAEDDAAARELSVANPGASVRQLVALMKSRRGCGSTRAFDAVQRTRGATSP